MIPFVVSREGDEPGQGAWVLAVDSQREALLLVDRDGETLIWVAMADCKFARAATPDQPTLVLAVQPQVGPQIVMPNRAMRRPNGGA